VNKEKGKRGRGQCLTPSNQVGKREKEEKKKRGKNPEAQSLLWLELYPEKKKKKKKKGFLQFYLHQGKGGKKKGWGGFTT